VFCGAGGALVGCGAGGAVDSVIGGGGGWVLPVCGGSSWSMVTFLRAGKQRAGRATLRRTPSGIAPFGVKVTFGRDMQVDKL
jgi:hypothetical protein